MSGLIRNISFRVSVHVGEMPTMIGIIEYRSAMRFSFAAVNSVVTCMRLLRIIPASYKFSDLRMCHPDHRKDVGSQQRFAMWRLCCIIILATAL